MNPNGDASLRLFFALWPDPTTRAALAALQARVRGRLVRYEDLHLTLAFLGQQSASVLPALKDVLAHLPPAEIVLDVDRFGYFVRNRIAWAGAHSTPDPLQEIFERVKEGLAGLAVPWDDRRNFKPHITLARDAQPPDDLVFDPIRWQVREVALVCSETHSQGPRYRIVASRLLDEQVRIPDPSEDAPLAGSS